MRDVGSRLQVSSLRAYFSPLCSIFIGTPRFRPAVCFRPRPTLSIALSSALSLFLVTSNIHKSFHPIVFDLLFFNRLPFSQKCISRFRILVTFGEGKRYKRYFRHIENILRRHLRYAKIYACNPNRERLRLLKKQIHGKIV